MELKPTPKPEMPLIGAFKTEDRSDVDVERERRMEELRKKCTFLLGGSDLEMVEIRCVLDENNMPYIDHGLSWGAKIEDYEEQIDELKTIGKNVIAVELDNATTIDGTIDINHHGERAHEQSSLSQVLGLLELQPTRRQEIISANDSGYIPAMQEYGATSEEITEIRRMDREAQGVTEEQERQAEIAIKQLKEDGRLTTVELPHSKSSTVTDRLFGQYDQLLVLSNDGESNFFGDGQVCSNLYNTFEGWAGGSGFGRKGENAYWGGKVPQEDVVEKIKEEIGHLDDREAVDLANTVFVVPNNDAEALAIQELLTAHEAQFLVTDQPWGASWDRLEPEVVEQLRQSSDKQIFGVELKGNSPFGNGENVDHHAYGDQDRTTEKTSLRQIAELLGVKLNTRQQFIEANDIGYIPAMNNLGEELGLMPDEIAYYIGQVQELEDRAQGVTPEIKEMAKKAVDEAYIYDERFIWIDLPTMTAMREVTNILYAKGKYKNLLYETTVVDTQEDAGRVIVFSKADVIALLKSQYSDEEITWNGGGAENGFWGIQINNNPGRKAEIAAQIRDQLESEILGYHRLIEQSDIETTKNYSDTVQVHTIGNPDAFYLCIKAAHDDNPHGAFLNMDYSPEDYADMTLFIINTGAAGIAVKPDGDIVSVFKNPNIARKDNMQRVNQALMLESLRAGGNKLDCFDGFLPKMYEQVGFVPICKLRFNDEYAPEGWNFDLDGRPDIVFMAHNGDSITEVTNRQQFGYPSQAETLRDAPYVEDYDQADEFVQEYLRNRRSNG